MFPKWFRYLIGFAVVAMAAASWRVAWGEEWPYNSRSSTITGTDLLGNGTLQTVYTPPSSSSVTTLIKWDLLVGGTSGKYAEVKCGTTRLFWFTSHNQAVASDPGSGPIRCVGKSVKIALGSAPVASQSFMLTYILGEVPSTSYPITFSPTNNTDVDVVASNSFSPVNNITSSGSFTIGSASFSLDTTALQSSIDALKFPWLLALPFFLFLYVLFSVISAIRKK